MKTSLVDRGSVERLLLLVGALESGLVDGLAGSEALPVDRVAQVAGTDPRATGVVLEALAAMGVVERIPPLDGSGMADGGTLYRLSALGRAHLVDQGPELERSGLLHQVNKLKGWLELPEVIRTGEPSSRGMARRDVTSRSLAMGERDPDVLSEIVRRCVAYSGSIRTMLDVGGAVGHLAREFSRRGVQATLFDREEVIPLARDFLGSDADGMGLVGGDYTVALPPGPFDLVYFGNVYHIYGAETNAQVTRDAFAITAPGGTVAIQGYLRGRSAEAAMFAVNMLRSTKEGEVWGEAEYRQWLGAAGFEGFEVIDLETAPAQLVLGRRPGEAA